MASYAGIMRCWKAACRGDLVGELYAHWPEFDSTGLVTCAEHAEAGQQLLGSKRVDGAPVVEVGVEWWAEPVASSRPE